MRNTVPATRDSTDLTCIKFKQWSSSFTNYLSHYQLRLDVYACLLQYLILVTVNQRKNYTAYI